MAGISLPIDLEDVEPVKATSAPVSEALRAVVGNSRPFCFAVPTVTFRVLWERPLMPSTQI